MNQNKQHTRKDISHSITPSNLSINTNAKAINYNISNVNNTNNLINSNINFPNNFMKESENTIDNNSDINFYLNSSLKDQILSPGDDDLYLYLNTNNQNQNIYQTTQNTNNNNTNAYNNKQNYNNDYDSNYYLNFDINNTTNFKSIENNSKKTLILDLDETLVHSSFHPLYFNGELIQPDIFFTILFENKTHDVYVLKRPYIKEFLNKMSKIYNIYIFTASIKEYAAPLLFKLDNNNVISKKMFRENCTLSKDNKYIKDLHILNENLKNVILIDNNPHSYRYNKCNGIPIKTRHFDKNDKELIKIIPFLTFLALVEDVREYIPKVVDNEQLNYNKVKNIINNSTINNIIKKDNSSKNKRIASKVKKHKFLNNNNYINNIINKNATNNNVKLKYSQNYEDCKVNIMANKNRNNDNDNNINNNNNIIENDENLFYNSKINFNNVEEGNNNNNYNTVLNNRKNFHIPGTINFREPVTHFQSSIFTGHKKKTHNNNNYTYNNMIISNGNININQINKNDDNENNKYQRSKSSNNFNELTNTMHKFSSINFNLVNSQSNNKKIKYGVSVDTKNQKSNIDNTNEIHKIYENKNMAEKCLSYNNLMNNRDNRVNINNSLYLDNNDPILVTYIQNNNINFNTNNNIMSINLQDDKSSNKNVLYKEIKGNKTQRNYNNNNNNNNNRFNKYRATANITNNNIFRNKNNLYKNKANDKFNFPNNKKINENSKNNGKNTNYDDTMDSSERKKSYNNVRNKKIKRIKSSSYRNNDYNFNKNNYNKKIPLTKTNDYKKRETITNINNNNCDNYDSIYYINNDNINNINKKVRSQTLNGQPLSSHRIYSKLEENKNCTMEISKNIKKKFYNNCLKENSILKDNNHKYNNIKNKNETINYNRSKQKNKLNVYRKNDLNNEMNLLNEFMKDFNKEQKEMSYLSNYQNTAKDNKTQRLPKMENRKKNISYNYNNEKLINSKNKNKKIEEEKNIKKNDIFGKKNIEQIDKDNFYTNFYIRKNKPYIISKETNNYIKKKMKNINIDDYYNNDNKNDNSNEAIKNIKFLSLQKEKKEEKSYEKLKIDNNEKLFNNKHNRRKNNYSSDKHNIKDFLGSRTINN